MPKPKSPTNRFKSTPEPDPAETILLAVTGMSPAILTETIWALAHQPEPVIPDRVIVLTTRAGSSIIERELLNRASPQTIPVWDALRHSLKQAGFHLDGKLRFGATADDIRVFTIANPQTGQTRELDDIRTPEENDAAADFILETVRGITSNPDQQLIASIAGGRKTMGALLYAAMSLLGRAEDRLTHVLVNEPFENPGLEPRFYFPNFGTCHEVRDRSGNALKSISSDEALLQLADVPFVRLRELFPQQVGRYPGRFTTLVQKYSRQIDSLFRLPELRLDIPNTTVWVDNKKLDLPIRAFALFSFLHDRAVNGERPFGYQKLIEEPFKRYAKQLAEQEFSKDSLEREKLRSLEWSDEDTRRQLSELRKQFIKHGYGELAKRLFPERGAVGFNPDWFSSKNRSRAERRTKPAPRALSSKTI